MTTLFEAGQKVKFNLEEAGGLFLSNFHGEGPFEIIEIKEAEKKDNVPSDLESICDCGDCEPVDHPQILVIEINHQTHRLSGAHFVPADDIPSKRIVKLTLTCPHCQNRQNDKEIEIDMNDPDSLIIINHGMAKCACGQTYKIEGNIDYSQSKL